MRKDRSAATIYPPRMMRFEEHIEFITLAAPML